MDKFKLAMAHALGKVKLDLSQTSYSGAGFHAKQQKPLKEQTWYVL